MSIYIGLKIFFPLHLDCQNSLSSICWG